MAARKKIYFAGASGTGKTTLTHRVAKTFSIPVVGSATALVSNIHGGYPDWSDLDACDGWQREVWAMQQRLEMEYQAHHAFVSERCFEVVSYTARQSTVLQEIVRSREWHAYIDKLRHEALIFFLRPCFEVEPDGRRDRFLSPAWRAQVDGVVELILEAHGLPYIPISTPDPKDRWRTVETATRLALQWP